MLGELISAGANLIGGFFNRQSQNEYNKQQMQIAQQNMALQREFAQSGIQWKVQDAKAAGLHPLAALGAQTSSFSPVSVGGSAPELDLGSAGQDIGRAVKAAMSQNDRAAQDEATARRLSLEKAGLENDILRQELLSKAVRSSPVSAQVGPGFPANTSVIPLPRPGPARTLSEGAAVGDDEIKQKAEDYPGTKIVRPFGYPLYANPWFNDGQQFEDRYGDSEIGSTVKFGVNTLADHVYSAYRRGWFDTRYKYPWYRGRR